MGSPYPAHHAVCLRAAGARHQAVEPFVAIGRPFCYKTREVTHCSQEVESGESCRVQDLYQDFGRDGLQRASVLSGICASASTGSSAAVRARLNRPFLRELTKAPWAVRVPPCPALFAGRPITGVIGEERSACMLQAGVSSRELIVSFSTRL